MSTSDDHLGDLDTWTVEHLEALVETRHRQELERIRVFAQTHAYRCDEPRHSRLRWARLSLLANRRLHGEGPWDAARMAGHEFALRTRIIGQLGPDGDPDWNPDALATDTLTALTLDPAEAGALSAGWRDLPIEQIGELRRHKNDRRLGVRP